MPESNVSTLPFGNNPPASNLIKYLNDEDMNLKAVAIMQVLKNHLIICWLNR